jgi:adhesin transport system membrane fusion protein
MKTYYKKNGAANMITNPKPAKYFAYGLISFHVFGLILLFLPWTQNVRSSGKLTTLTPSDRPQDIHSIIDGRVEIWYVKEGDIVKAGDTIVFISETKDTYWDPNLLNRTKEQLEAKESMIESYEQKISALTNQKGAEKNNLDLKLLQATNKVSISKKKVSIDSSEVQAAKISENVANDQYNRAQKMYSEDGIISLKDLEDRRIKMAEATNKYIAAENKLANSRQEYINATIELSAIQTEYYSKIYKIDSDIGSASSDMYKSKEDLSKLSNQYSNYAIRRGNYFVTAPKDGQIVKIFKHGIGENVKQGEPIASITSLEPNYAVELYIEPVDMPLMKIGKKVRVLFDGWPTIIFSGWPGASYGTFGGRVAALDSDISPNGKYRILVAPDPDDSPWPSQLRVGMGAKGIALLNKVPVWYELWRKISGFPPDFYQPEDGAKTSTKIKK